MTSPEARPSEQEGLFPAMVAAVEPDGEAVLIVVEEREEPPSGRPQRARDHRAGQHAGLRPVGFSIARPFSFVDSGDGKVKFLVGGDGAVSSHLRRSLPGEMLSMSSASGSFTFVTPPGRDVLLIAGGVGIAPIIGLARESSEAGNRTTLVSANRSHAYLDRSIERLEAEYPGLRVIRIMSRPDSGWRGPRGRLTVRLLHDLLSGAGRPGRGADWYVCGSPGFCDNTRAIAQALGVRRLHEEPFTAALNPPEPPDFEATVTFSRSEAGRESSVADPPAAGRRVTVNPGQTILEAAVDAGVQIEYSCMSGTCRECECLVESGSAVQAVAPSPVEAGVMVRTCVAYPAAADGLVLSNARKPLRRP